MLSDEVLDKVIERLVLRIEEGNTYTLKKIGQTINKIRDIPPSDVHRLNQILENGGDYDKIVKKLAEITKLNEQEIYEIFEEVAKKDYQFAEQFYKYRNKKYIPYEFNKQLQEQVKAIAKVTADEYINMSRTLAFSKKVNGKVVYSEIGTAYQEIIDKAIMSVGQGKETFNDQLRQSIVELGRSGLKTVDWESGTSRRLDSAVRMHLKAGLKNLHNEMQLELGKEFDSNGVEVSVHQHPAPDHEQVQGRQFSNDEFNKFQNDEDSVDITGKKFPAISEETKQDRRAIGQYNCYHYVFSIIIGVNEPQYTEEQLQEIIDDNEKGFDYGGKHYTLYEGTQLQRRIETAIRKEKDAQIIAKAGGFDDEVQDAEKNINSLLKEYVEVSKISGLPTKMDRLKVDGYKQVPIT